MTILHLDAAPRRFDLVAKLRDWSARRHEERALRIGTERLAGISAHLLADIGIDDRELLLPDPTPVTFGRT